MPDGSKWLARYSAKQRARAQSCAAPATGVKAAAAPSPAAMAGSLNNQPAIAAAVATAVAAERVRVRTILEAPEASGREDTAKELAFQTGLEAVEARRLLAGMQPDVDARAATIAGWGRRQPTRVQR